jgi:alanyl-tRNA synthetase
LTDCLHSTDPYLLEFDARVIEHLQHEGRPAVVLDRTAFYAESGGQPWDTGTLGGCRVVAVVDVADRRLHVLDSPLEANEVHGIVDAARRRDHLQQHHGQHLLSRAILEVAGANTVSFHLGAASTSVDLDAYVGDEKLALAEQRANQVVWEARPVSVRTLSRTQAVALGVAVPAEAGDAVRLVDAEGFDVQACGGTHPRSTAEVGVILLTDTERYKGGTRVRFVCGDRAVLTARSRFRILADVGARLSAPVDGIEAALEGSLDRLASSERRLRELQADAVAAEVGRLAAGVSVEQPLVVHIYEGWSADDLRTLATSLVERARCIALIGGRSDKAQLVFAQSPGFGCDVPGLLRRAAERLGGRGGGRGNLAQAGGDDIAALEPALDAARAEVLEALRARL